MTMKRRDELEEPNTAETMSNIAVRHPPEIRRVSRIRPWYPVLLLVMVLGAGVLGALLIRLASTDNQLHSIFAGTNQFDDFTALVAGLFGVSVVVASFTWPTFWRIFVQVGWSARAAAILLYLLVSAAVVTGPFLVQSGNAIVPLSHFDLRIGILYAIPLVAALGSFCGLVLLTYIQYERIGHHDAAAPADEIHSVLETRTYIQRFFLGAATLITLAVVVIGGLQSALKAGLQAYQVNYDNNIITSIPIVASISVGTILLYGIFFAALLAFAVIPAYTGWQAHAADLRDYLYPLPGDGCAPQSWYDGRSNVEALLQMRAGFGSTTLAIFGILAPLVGSIISVIIPALQS